MTKYRIYKHEADDYFHIQELGFLGWREIDYFVTLDDCKEFLEKKHKKMSKQKELIEEIEI